MKENPHGEQFFFRLMKMIALGHMNYKCNTVFKIPKGSLQNLAE